MSPSQRKPAFSLLEYGRSENSPIVEGSLEGPSFWVALGGFFFGGMEAYRRARKASLEDRLKIVEEDVKALKTWHDGIERHEEMEKMLSDELDRRRATDID